MDCQIVWTEPAVADFKAIIAYIEQRNTSPAERIRAAIVEHVEILGSFPLIGPTYRRDPQGETREIVCRKHRIFYRVIQEAKRVEILTVWHASRQEPELPV